MKILFVSHESKLNGASLSLLGMIDELNKNKINKVYVLTCYKKGPFIEELKKRRVEIIYSFYRKWFIYRPNNKILWIVKKNICLLLCQINYLSAVRLKKIIKQENIEIIHTNTSVINIGAILADFCDIPHIWHIREFGQEDFNIWNIYNKKRMFSYFNKSKYIITVSNALKEKYKKDISSDKLQVIYNGVNKQNINSKNFTLIKERINLIISGAVTPAKGQMDAILALNELIKKGYTDIILYIAGSGQMKEIKDKVDELNLSTYVVFLGHINNLHEIRKNIDLELVCSKSEAFGRVTIEAMMSMIPVIGSNSGGTKELINDTYNGFLYDKGNYIDLAEKIEYFLKNKKEIERMGVNANKFAQGFTVEKNLKEINNIYKKVLNK